MAFRIMVYEQEHEKRTVIHACLDRYAFQHNLECDVLWLQAVLDERQQETYFPGMQLALISLDMPGARVMGEALYTHSPDCRIYYFRNKLCNLEPLLPTRPVSFCAWTGETDELAVFEAKLRAVFEDVMRSPGTLCLNTRTGLYLLPKKDIRYLQSDLKYVIVRMTMEEDVRVFRRLSDVESGLGFGFVRIHKSYIVNRAHVRLLDKARRMVVMDNGEQLPVSESQYEEAVKGLLQE